MDHAGAGKINEIQPGQPAAAPNPSCLDRIHEQADDGGIHAIGGELRTLRHSARYNGGCRGAEDELKDKSGPVKAFKVPEHAPLRFADEAKRTVRPHHQPVAEQEEHHRPDAEIHQVFHNDVPRVLRPGKAGFHHSKAALHKKHENRADQKPNRHIHIQPPLKSDSKDTALPAR